MTLCQLLRNICSHWHNAIDASGYFLGVRAFGSERGFTVGASVTRYFLLSPCESKERSKASDMDRAVTPTADPRPRENGHSSHVPPYFILLGWLLVLSPTLEAATAGARARAGGRVRMIRCAWRPLRAQTRRYM